MENDADKFDFVRPLAAENDPVVPAGNGIAAADIVPVKGTDKRELIPVKQAIDIDAPKRERGGIREHALDFLKKMGVAFSIASALASSPSVDRFHRDMNVPARRNHAGDEEAWENVRFGRRKQEVEDSSDGLQQAIPHYDKGGQVDRSSQAGSDSGVFRKIKSISDRIGSGVKTAAGATSKAVKKTATIFSIASALSGWGDLSPVAASVAAASDSTIPREVQIGSHWLDHDRRRKAVESKDNPKVVGKVGESVDDLVMHYEKGGQVTPDSDSGVFQKIKSISGSLGSGVKSAAETASKAVKKTATAFSIVSALSGWGDISSVAASASASADSSTPREVAIATHWLGHDRRRKSAETKESPKASGKAADGIDDPAQHFDKGGTVNEIAPAKSGMTSPLPRAKDFASNDQIEAIRKYQNDGLYTKTNDFLRGTDESAGALANLWHRIATPSSTKRAVESIDSLMMSDEAILPAMTVHRAMVIPEAGENNKNIFDLIGKTISEPAFSSTSVSREATDNFMTREDRVRAEIRIPERTRGLSLDPDDTGVESKWKNEKEVLVDRGAKYKVVDVFRGEDKRWNAKLELLSTRHGNADIGEEEKTKTNAGDGGRESEPVIHRETGGPIPEPAPVSAFKSDGEIPVHPDVPADADEVPIKAKAGEFVVRKEQAQKFKPVLEAINNDDIPRVAAVAADDGADHFERGGEVGEPKPKAKSSNGGAGVKSFFDFESDVAHLPPSVREKAYAHYTSQQAERGALTPDFVKEEFRENKPEDITQYRHARKERESGFQEARENWDEQRKERKYDKITQQFERDYPQAFDEVISAIKRDGLSNSDIIHQHLPEEFRDESSSGWISHLRASSRKAQDDELPLTDSDDADPSPSKPGIQRERAKGPWELTRNEFAANAIPDDLRSGSTPALVKQMFMMNGGAEVPRQANEEPRRGMSPELPAQSGENPSLSTDVKPAAPSLTPPDAVSVRTEVKSQSQPADDWRSEWKRANAARPSAQEQGGASFADLQKKRESERIAAMYAEAAARREAKRTERPIAGDADTFHKATPQQSENINSHIAKGESVVGDVFGHSEPEPKKSPARGGGGYDSPKKPGGDDAAAKAERDSTIARLNKSREAERDAENKQRVFDTKSAIAKESGAVDYDDHFESVRGELNKVIDDVGQQPPLATGKRRYFHGGQKIDAGDDHMLDVFTPSVEEAAYAAMLAERPVSYVDLDEEKTQNLNRNYHADPSETQSSTVLFDTFDAKKKREDDTPVARSQFTPTKPQEPLPKRGKKPKSVAEMSNDELAELFGISIGAPDDEIPTALRADGIPGDSAPIATEAKAPARKEASPRSKPRSKRKGGRAAVDVKTSNGGKDADAPNAPERRQASVSPDTDMPTALSADGVDADSAPIATAAPAATPTATSAPGEEPKTTSTPANVSETDRLSWKMNQRFDLSQILQAGAYATDLIGGKSSAKGPTGWGSTKEDGDFYQAVYGKSMPRGEDRGPLSGASDYLRKGAALTSGGGMDWMFGDVGSKGLDGMLGGASKAMRGILGGGEDDPRPGGGKGGDDGTGKMVGKIATTAAKFAFPEAAPLIAMAEKTGIVDKLFSSEGGGMFGGGGGLGGALGGLLGGGDGKDGRDGKDETGSGEVAKLLRELIDIIKGQGKAGEQPTGYGNTQSHPSLNLSIPGLINAIGLMANAPRG